MKILFIIVLLFCNTIAVSQTRTTNDLSLVNEIPVKKFFILQVGKTQWDFITKTRQHIPATKTDSNWHTYKATGKIDQGGRAFLIRQY